MARDKEGVCIAGQRQTAKDATTHSKGIVDTEDGEIKKVWGTWTDRRLKDATVDNHGFVTLAKHGENRTLHCSPI
jgi:hypothetical protein